MGHTNMGNDFQYDVFLSHTSHDIEFVRHLTGWLRACGSRIWLAEEQLVPGSRFRAGLEQGIRESRDLIAVLTPAYCTRPWTQREIDLFDLEASLSERRILGVQVGDVDPSVMDQVFTVNQRISWNGQAFDPEGFWLLHCGLSRNKPGPKSDWASKGARLIESKQPTSATASLLHIVKIDQYNTQPSDTETILVLIADCLRVTEHEWKRSFSELRKILQAQDAHLSKNLMLDLWATGRAEEAATLFAASGESDNHYGAWAFLDAGCNPVARWMLISRLIQRADESEVWFSWAVCDMAWEFLPTVASKAPAGALRDHFVKLAYLANRDGLSFREAEAEYDYGIMITPWNHFHLTWLAVRLGDICSASAHVRTLCETALQGDIRAGRFLARICNWPVFQPVLTDSTTSELVVRARLSLSLDEKEVSVGVRQRLQEIWFHARHR